jgi:serralysin
MADNQDHYCMCITADDLPAADQASLAHHRAAVLKNSRWQPGQTISVRFLEGDPQLQRRVRDVALEWTRIANLQFQFVNTAPTDIRIAFAQGKGSWSYLGTVCRSIEEPKPTMNYGWLTPASDDKTLRRVVLHEFGHAVGLIHEHQNPKGGIKWNKPAVINDLSGPPNNWDQAKIENNMFRFYPPTDVVATDVDSDSIMMYPIPRAWTLDGFSAGMNGELSDNDKALIRSVYPR